MVEGRNKILKFDKYNIELHYWAFDIDDNLFHMPTVIHMEKRVGDDWVPIDVSTSEFAKVRNDRENYRLLPGDLSFSEFRDTGPRGNRAFIEDMKIAIKNKKFGPSWKAFLECLRTGSIFALITARGNEPSTYRTAVEWIIDNYLDEEDKFLLYSNSLKHAYIFGHPEDFDRIPKGVLSKTPLIKAYLDDCDFYGVSSNYFISKFGYSSAQNPEKAKELALESFIEKCNRWGEKVGAKSVSIGFSDDDPKNVEHVNIFFKEKLGLMKDILPHKLKLNLYKTTDPTIKGGVRTKFHEAADSTIAPGMASSVMPFSQFNNMSDRMFTNPQEYDKSSRLGNKYITKMSKEIFQKKKVKK